MIELSVVIITRNEERNIGRCLDSVKEVADDIVVVDSFSTDRTEEICREKGARFVQHKFHGHIEQKNWAITQAKFQFILSLDADEALSEKLKQSILHVKKNWTHDGFYMNRLTNYCGKWIKHCGWYPDEKLRLWDASKGKWRGENPHDKFELYEGDKAAGFLKGDILHYSYYTLEDHYKQVRYFTDISSKVAFHKKKKSYLLKRIFSPVVKFIWDYFFRLCFLDGRSGFTVCRISAYATYLKYHKLHLLYKQRESAPQH